MSSLGLPCTLDEPCSNEHRIAWNGIGIAKQTRMACYNSVRAFFFQNDGGLAEKANWNDYARRRSTTQNLLSATLLARIVLRPNAVNKRLLDTLLTPTVNNMGG